MTLVDCKLYIIGGSYGQDYLKDVYILDADPCPDFTVDIEKSKKDQSSKLITGLASMLNKEEFSDITFIVEDRKFFGHRIVISQLSERFKAMLSGMQGKAGFIES
jgi:leucine-zipper-like transcriptional regulator 1